MFKKKKGVTLIEAILYLSLLSVVFSIAFISFSYIRNRHVEIVNEDELSKIKQFFIIETVESSKTEEAEQILFEKNSIYAKKSKRRVQFSNLRLKTESMIGTSFDISRDGLFNKSFNIQLIDKRGEIYNISSCTKCKKLHY